jgi:SHS2 domain-containing protein
MQFQTRSGLFLTKYEVAHPEEKTLDKSQSLRYHSQAETYTKRKRGPYHAIYYIPHDLHPIGASGYTARSSPIMTTSPYEVFEHTADIGIHAYGNTLAELFMHAAQGMESLLVAPEQVQIITSRDITVEGHDNVSLLIAWLNELIFLFDTEYLLFRTFVIESISATSLSARASGEAYDVRRHDLSSAIKAVTWHEASVTHNDEGYKARIIFDI